MGKSMEAWHSTPSEGSVRREAPGCCGKKNGIGVTHHDRVLNYSCTLESRWLASILAISNPLEIYKYMFCGLPEKLARFLSKCRSYIVQKRPMVKFLKRVLIME